ncbi:MAG: CTP synthase, partial [Clostridium sp.]|nr:CTP synthase [Clostridium sp.]
PLTDDVKGKIGLFCNVDANAVIQNLDAEDLYEVPMMLHNEGLDTLVCDKLNLNCSKIDNAEWIDMVNKIKNLKENVNIGLVGKYVELHDAYISVVEALNHGGIPNNASVNIKWINAEHVTKENVESYLKDVNGILVPGGFGDRGVEGKIEAIKYARVNKVPFLGICLGMQCSVIEFARNILNYSDANSSEINENSSHPVIDLMPDQKDIDEKGGTMRLGLYPCKLDESSNAFKAYGQPVIYERHRHRYEFNNEYRKRIIEAGLSITGLSPDDRLVEIVEVKDHPWFVATQFHPELKSRPNRPHPLFRDFIKAALENK